MSIESQDAMHTLGSHRVYIHGIHQIKSFVSKGVNAQIAICTSHPLVWGHLWGVLGFRLFPLYFVRVPPRPPTPIADLQIGTLSPYILINLRRTDWYIPALQFDDFRVFE